jgi:cytoskeletal protein CcmA (bactofilin family)
MKLNKALLFNTQTLDTTLKDQNMSDLELSNSITKDVTTYPAALKAIIASSMVIRGGLNVETDLLVGGTIHGDVYCKQNVETKAGFQIYGNIHAESFYAVGGHIEGNLSCDDRIEIDMGTSLKGTLEADSLILNGDIQGDVIAYASVRLGMHAKLRGNIRTAHLIVDKGAILNGTVETIVQENF